MIQFNKLERNDIWVNALNSAVKEVKVDCLFKDELVSKIRRKGYIISDEEAFKKIYCEDLK